MLPAVPTLVLILPASSSFPCYFTGQLHTEKSVWYHQHDSETDKKEEDLQVLACCSARQGGEYLFVYVFCENAVCVIGKKPARLINDEELLLLHRARHALIWFACCARRLTHWFLWSWTWTQFTAWIRAVIYLFRYIDNILKMHTNYEFFKGC